MPTFNKSTAEATISRADQCGNRFFVMVDHTNKTFIWGWSTGCFVSPYSAGLITENATQKTVRLHIETYQNNPDYTEIATLEDYKESLKGA
jgi:hypothetical protein